MTQPRGVSQVFFTPDPVAVSSGHLAPRGLMLLPPEFTPKCARTSGLDTAPPGPCPFLTSMPARSAAERCGSARQTFSECSHLPTETTDVIRKCSPPHSPLPRPPLIHCLPAGGEAFVLRRGREQGRPALSVGVPWAGKCSVRFIPASYFKSRCMSQRLK